MRRKEDRVEGSCSSVSCHDFHLDVKVTECYACRKKHLTNYDTMQCDNPKHSSHLISSLLLELSKKRSCHTLALVPTLRCTKSVCQTMGVPPNLIVDHHSSTKKSKFSACHVLDTPTK